MFEIRLPSEYKGKQMSIRVLNSPGEELMSYEKVYFNNLKLNISEYCNGVYYLKVKYRDSSQLVKLILSK